MRVRRQNKLLEEILVATDNYSLAEHIQDVDIDRVVYFKQKAKPKPHVKKLGKQADNSQFLSQLDALSLKIIKVTADGNCFFRALADQLEGDEEQHGKYRCMVVQYIVKRHEIFEPFIEDDVPFDEYCQSMEKDGTWAGHMELQTASLVTRRIYALHGIQNMSPRWYIKNFDGRATSMIHLSYHDEEHYNSVRSKEDPCNGPAIPIVIKADADISASSNQAKAAVSKTKGAAGKDSINAGSIKLVMARSGCESVDKVEQVLVQVDGDVDAAIEFLIAEQGDEEGAATDDSHSCHANGSYGNDENRNNEQHKEETVEKPTEQGPSSDGNKTLDGSTSQPDEKKIPRNKLCPCGSKKKYKSCCGSVSGRSSNKLIVNQTMDVRKGKKERKQGKKGVSAKSAASPGSDGGPPDVGALCI
ncbi:OVARIAN TUMOR DOMAIN-containing deubiquitinating enzyme 7-like [Hibiscus syriacus]|uniref:OVARIAN TUMOR DOMAIN-containing deubiquitinating enzyme 7-like n=1 Tax=Hibiscus syriacus TaxID=106335 RepID=UPI001920EED2|nr:OVARIAN TUMOR DOMAIN-containing deubiquitinating enzyme 7-like [Hibiscus syriacus]